MELVNGLEKTLDLVAGLVEVFIEKLGGLFAALELRLEIFDCPVDVSNAASFGAASGL